jgi:glycosyltransferase involved in cell wall biosynthesis
MKTIALVDWNWAGHHPTYFKHFVLALEQLDSVILALCPEPDDARIGVADLRASIGEDRRASTRTEYRKLLAPPVRRVRPARLGAIEWAIRHFLRIEDEVRRWERQSGNRTDLIFYACIYDWDFEWLRFAKPFLSIPCSGLYLHPLFRMPGKVLSRTGRLPCPEKIFGGSLFKSLAILDEQLESAVATAVNKPVVIFPDLSDNRLPNNGKDTPLLNRLRSFAHDRPVVGLFGHLQASKGMVTLAQAAKDSRSSKICFAFGGEVLWHSFNDQEHSLLQDVMNNCANVWCHLIRIPDEPVFNSLLLGCDVLYAAYIGFPHSSNILAKAAALEKPVIVSDGYLMAERVRRFNLGEVVPPGDVNASVCAILQLTSNYREWVSSKQPRWCDFRAKHSFERLIGAFQQILAQPSGLAQPS